MKARFIIPLILFLLIIALLWRGLSLHPAEVPSPLINKPAPGFQLPTLFNSKKIMTQKDFIGHITLLNIWATWCGACAEEHAFLLTLAKNKNFMLVGFDYKDDTRAAKKWLQENGNPYQYIMIDKDGMAAIDWGVYGTPETFVIDQNGIIRYKQIGPLTSDNWEKKIKPLVDTLQGGK